MSLLLDTCALIWLGNGDPALSLDARQMIEESEEVYVSPISLWEVSNKCRKGKLQLKFPPREWFDRWRYVPWACQIKEFKDVKDFKVINVLGHNSCDPPAAKMAAVPVNCGRLSG